MNPEKTSPQLSVSVEKVDSCKLVSLLALATGAAAMPQTSNADIFYSDHTASPITVGSTASSSYLINDLPGTARIIVQFAQQGTTSFTSYRFVVLRQNAGYVRMKTSAFIAANVPAGMLWTQIGGFTSKTATAGAANLYNHNPNSFSDGYYAFRFKDSTAGNAFRYGWINVNFSNGNLSVSEGPHLTIFGWAYDNTGAPIPMGAIPEPSSTAILVLGALTLGSKGLRSWRRNRATAADKP